jgi:hypothetical protein
MKFPIGKNLIDDHRGTFAFDSPNKWDARGNPLVFFAEKMIISEKG